MFVDTEVRPQGEPQKVGTLKLSEAIRIGAKLRPQGKGFYFSEGRSCALGAAYEAVTGKYHEQGNYWDGPNLVEWFDDHFKLSVRFGHDIAKMNDSGESRERIADWLGSQGL